MNEPGRQSPSASRALLFLVIAALFVFYGQAAGADNATRRGEADEGWQTAESAETMGSIETGENGQESHPAPEGEIPGEDAAPASSAESDAPPAGEEYMSAQSLDLSNIQFATPRNATPGPDAPEAMVDAVLDEVEATTAPEGGGKLLTLLEACRLAVKHHPLTEEAVATKEEEEANYGEARSVYFPRISLSANLGPSQDLDTDVTEYGDTTLAVTQTIFNFGGLQSDVAAARLRADSARLRFARTNEDIAALAINSYLTILQAQALVDVYNETLDFYQKLLDTFWERYNTGISSKADAQKVQVSLKSTESQLVIQNEQLKTARSLLQNIIKEPVDAVENDLRLLTVDLDGTVEDSYERALQNNISLRATTAEIEAQEELVYSAHTEYLPSLGYRLEAKNEFEKIDGYKQTLDAQLTLNWNLFNGFATDERIKKQRAVLRRLKAAKRSTELEVQNIITDAFNSFAASQQEYLLAKQAYDDSVYLMSLYLSEFDLGIRTLLDLITAREGQTSAAVREVNSRFTKIRAALNIILEEGRLEEVLGLPLAKGFF